MTAAGLLPTRGLSIVGGCGQMVVVGNEEDHYATARCIETGRTRGRYRRCETPETETATAPQRECH